MDKYWCCWGKYRESGFWVSDDKEYKLRLAVDSVFVAFHRLRVRLVLLENTRAK